MDEERHGDQGLHDPEIPLAVLELIFPGQFSVRASLTSTPASALRPIELALARTVSHHEKNCRHAPPPLRPLAGMREQALTAENSLAVMRSALWEYRDHEFIRRVVELWLGARSTALTTAWGAHPTGVGFPDVLEAAKGFAERLRELASGLWALGLDQDPELGWGFSAVCFLLQNWEKTPQPTFEVQERSANRIQKALAKIRATEIDPLMTKLTGAREENRKLRGEKRRLTEEVERLRKENESLRAQVEASSPTLERLQQAHDALVHERDAQLRRISELERDLRRQDRREQTASDQREETAAELTITRKREASLSTLLNDARLRIRELERLLSEGVPNDQKVNAYLQREASRIEGNILRLQGGDQERARKQKTLLKQLKDAFLNYRPAFRQPRPASRQPARPLRYYALGGASEIGASAYVVEMSGHRILIDCGIRVGARELDELGPQLEALGAIDALVLTHAHTDHSGWIPALVRKLGELGDFEILATEETAQLLPIMLKDSRKHYVRMMAQAQLMSRHMSERPPVEEAYEGPDIDDALNRIRPIRYRETVPLRGDLQVTLHSAGHVLGASSVLLEGGGRRVFLSGDFSDFFQRTVGSHGWPIGDLAGVDLLLLESTYGGKDLHGDRVEEEELLVHQVSRIVEAGGVALIPSFALGRAQEVLSILAKAEVSFPVWIDGMIQDINSVFKEANRLTLKPHFHERRNEGYEIEELIELSRTEPCAIVSTSGMLSGGPMVEYAAALLPDSKNCIFFCGYQDEESPGRQLQILSRSEGARVITVPRDDGTETMIRAGRPAGTFKLSAHADHAGLVKVVEDIHPDRVVLVHGDDDARSALSEDLTSRGHAVHPSPSDYAIDCE